jgi:hypothetical protein
MFRRLLAIVPVLITLSLAGEALANRKVSPQQKGAATREYAKRAKRQFGPNARVKVKYAGPTGRDASVEVLGVGGITGNQPNALLGIGSGRVVVHRKPALVKKNGVVDATLKNGRYQTIFSILPASAP